MEATASDPTVQQQFGMTVGIPNAGQVRALGMLNIRGQRSVTCKGDFDRHPSAGPLPPGAPRGVRGIPQAAGRARARRRARQAVRPQSRSCGDADVLHPVLVQGSVRHQGHALDRRRRCRATTWIFRRATTRWWRSCATRARSSTPRRTPPSTTDAGPAIRAGRITRRRCLPSVLGYQRSTWAGNPCNSYDTTRAASIGSSSGSGVSVGTNLVMCSLCEETGQSCRGPANHNSVALILPHKAHLSFLGGAIGAEIYNDRAGIHCRAVTDAVQGARRAQGSGQRLLRPARHLHHGAALEPAERALRQARSPAARRARSRACASASSASSWSSTRRSTSRSSTRPRPR